MIHFPEIRARRFTIRLRELTLRQALDLAARPSHLEQANTTAFLRFATVDPEIDPARWRVGERTLAVAHYLACVMGDPDYPIGAGHYSDYLVPEEAEIPEAAELGEAAGDVWRMRHLDGRLAEAIERLEDETLTGRGLWLIGSMAAQMFRSGEPDPNAMTDGALDEWLAARVRDFGDLAESDFEALLLAFALGRKTLVHLFRFDVDDSGLVCLPAREDAGLAPARFSVRANIAAWTQSMAARSH